MFEPTEPFRNRLIGWLPGLVAGIIAWVAFILIGDTPLIRASGMAFAIAGVTLALKRWSPLLAVAGGLALAVSPAFWLQTGGADSFGLGIVLVALTLATGAAIITIYLSKRPALGIVAGSIIFTVLFLTVISQPGSLRLYTLLTAWLLFLLVDSLRLTNPRPEEAPAVGLDRVRLVGILLLLSIGIANDSLMTLLSPAVILGLFLAQARAPWWYWLLLIAVTVIGAYNLALTYLDSGWWLYPADQAVALNVEIPYAIAGGWREPSRWLGLVELVIGQFTVVGLILGVFGLARMSRWYPPLGVVTMVAYASYAVFGLVYFGRDSTVRLLPLLMIQMIWMTYAVYTLSQWLQRTIAAESRVARRLTTTILGLLPLILLLLMTLKL